MDARFFVKISIDTYTESGSPAHVAATQIVINSPPHRKSSLYSVPPRVRIE